MQVTVIKQVSVAQWIEQISPKDKMGVRLPPGTPYLVCGNAYTGNPSSHRRGGCLFCGGLWGSEGLEYAGSTMSAVILRLSTVP